MALAQVEAQAFQAKRKPGLYLPGTGEGGEVALGSGQIGDVGVELKDEGDQNARANANWPLTEQERMTVASKLVKFAKMLLND